MRAEDWLPWVVGSGLVLLYFGGGSKRSPASPVDVPAMDRDVPPSAPVVPAEFRNFKLPPLPGYSRMRQRDVPAAVMPKLLPLLALPLGTVTKVPTDGRDIIAVNEPHRDDARGWHKGVSLFERKGAAA